MSMTTTTTTPQPATTTHIEILDGTSRCREFNAAGRQCGNYTRRVVVVERPGRPDLRTSDCGQHGERSR